MTIENGSDDLWKYASFKEEKEKRVDTMLAAYLQLNKWAFYTKRHIL